MRTILAVLMMAAVGRVQAQGIPAYPYVPDKKVVEFGWDAPTASFVSDNIREMEKRPFDGVCFWPGNRVINTFDLDDWTEDQDAVDTAVLKNIAWSDFTTNFLILWSSDEEGMDYFNDDHWRTILRNMRHVARMAKESGCRGVLFDTEYYSDKSPWSRSDHAKGHSRSELYDKMRLRGGQTMAAWQDEYPGLTVLSMYLLAYLPDDWEMLPAFVHGMLDSIEPGTIMIEGNEESYYWGNTNSWFNRYDYIKNALPDEHFDGKVRRRWNEHVQTGMSLYDREITRDDHSASDKAKRWEHNVYMGLMTSDEITWTWFEAMNWWGSARRHQPIGWNVTSSPPAYFEEGLRRARRKYKEGKALGWDMVGGTWSDGNVSDKISVSVSGPRDGETYAPGETIAITAEASGGSIDRVDCYVNMVAIGQEREEPYEFSVADLPPGDYDIVARARDGSTSGTSAPVRITVRKATAAGRRAPACGGASMVSVRQRGSTVTVVLPGGRADGVALYGTDGRRVRSYHGVRSPFTIDASRGLTAGMYYLRGRSGGRLFERTFVISR